MRVGELLDRKQNEYSTYSDLVVSRVIALDAKDGKVLFDTSRNKKEFVEKFYRGVVIHIWADVSVTNTCSYDPYIRPVIKIYVSHRSWL